MTTTVEKVLYTAKTHTTGGRDGASCSSDGAWASTLCRPAGPATVPILSNSSPPVGRRASCACVLADAPGTGQM